MLSIEVELLTGRYVATRFNDRNRVEWPPHPARLFSAAVAAWADADEPDPAERAVLEWWETLGAPDIACSSDDQWSERDQVVHYVPVNDTKVVAQAWAEKIYGSLIEARSAVADDVPDSEEDRARRRAHLERTESKASDDSMKFASNGPAPEGAIQILPDQRGRQARIYPTAVPFDPVVAYRWPAAEGDAQQVATLDALLARIARLGHSSSLVNVTASPAADPERKPSFLPSGGGQVAIRVAAPGQLESLERAFASHGGSEPRTLAAEIVTYAPAGQAEAPVRTSHFGQDWVIMEPASGRFSVRDTLALTRTIRAALMAHSASDPSPEIITGHVPAEGRSPTPPTTRPHLAIVPLPFVASRHADGSILGIALVLPKEASVDERTAVLVAAGTWLDTRPGSAGGELRMGRGGMATLRRTGVDETRSTLTPERWTAASRYWASVTPVALDRHPGDLRAASPAKRDTSEASAIATIGRACQHIGLPSPLEVAILFDPPVRGTRKVRDFPPYAVQNGKLRRALVHARITFAEPVSGPVIIGAGRYLGYGLCVPLDTDGRPR